jgi:DNA-binding MarR family transcriptional regulator
MPGMPTRRPDPPSLTPDGRLDETLLQQVLGYQLAQATIVTDAVFHQEVGEPLQLRRVEYTVLSLVAQNPGGSAARIARALAVTPPHVTVILDRLEARKLVQRKASTEDRRSRQLSVTRAGDELLNKATGRIVAAERRVMGLSTGELAILAELLHKVACRRDALARPASDAGRAGGS